MKPKTFFAVVLLIISLGAVGFSYNHFIITKPHKSVRLPTTLLDHYTLASPANFPSVNMVWIPYYHRHTRIEEAETALESLFTESPESEDLLFFAILAQEDSSLKKKLVKRLKSLPEEQRLPIMEFMDGAEPNAATLEAVMWARYAFSGDLVPIENYIQTLVAPGITTQRQQEMLDTLLDKARIYHPVYQSLKEIAEAKDGSELSALLHRPVSTFTKRVYNTSATLARRAENHLPHKEFEKALEALEMSQKIYGDAPYTFYVYGLTLRDMGNYPDAITALTRSNWLYENHNDKVVLNVIGKIYDTLGDLETAVDYYRRCLAIDADHFSSIVDITYALYRLGRREEAVRYANEIIAKSNDMQYLSWAREVLEDLNADLTAADQHIREVGNNLQNLFLNEQFDALEQQLQDAFDQKLVDDFGRYQLYEMYKAFLPRAGNLEEHFTSAREKLEKWLAQKPDSHFANACMGVFYVDYGWFARGNGYASSITDKGREDFRARILLAEKYLVRAYELNPKDSSVAKFMMTVAKVHPTKDDSYLDEWYSRAIDADAADYHPYYTRFFYLAPQWGGSLEEQLGFARKAAKNAPQGSVVPSVLILAHWEFYRKKNDPDYFKAARVWGELKPIFNDLVRAYPDSNYYHNKFARTALLAGDMETAKNELRLAGDTWHELAWDSEKQFQEAKKRLGLL